MPAVLVRFAAAHCARHLRHAVRADAAIPIAPVRHEHPPARQTAVLQLHLHADAVFLFPAVRRPCAVSIVVFLSVFAYMQRFCCVFAAANRLVSADAPAAAQAAHCSAPAVLPAVPLPSRCFRRHCGGSLRAPPSDAKALPPVLLRAPAALAAVRCECPTAASARTAARNAHTAAFAVPARLPAFAPLRCARHRCSFSRPACRPAYPATEKSHAAAAHRAAPYIFWRSAPVFPAGRNAHPIRSKYHGCAPDFPLSDPVFAPLLLCGCGIASRLPLPQRLLCDPCSLSLKSHQCGPVQ